MTEVEIRITAHGGGETRIETLVFDVAEDDLGVAMFRAMMDQDAIELGPKFGLAQEQVMEVLVGRVGGLSKRVMEALLPRHKK